MLSGSHMFFLNPMFLYISIIVVVAKIVWLVADRWAGTFDLYTYIYINPCKCVCLSVGTRSTNQNMAVNYLSRSLCCLATTGPDRSSAKNVITRLIYLVV